MRRTVALILVLAGLSGTANGQSDYEEFKRLFKANDTAGMQVLLRKWETAKPNDPEFYTSAFNYYFSGSKQEIVSLQTTQPDGEHIALLDSAGATAGYMGSSMGYDPDKLRQALDYIDRGIRKFPNRLDMRFGKCYALGQIGDYGAFTREIITTLEYSDKIKNAWLWTEHKKQADAQNFMLGSVQAYMKQLYDTEDDSLLDNMTQIGETALKYYPNNIEIRSTTAVALMLTKHYDRAIAHLKHAEKLNPIDYIVLNNIAQGYALQGDKASAIRYYKLTEQYGDEQAKQQAREKIEELNR